MTTPVPPDSVPPDLEQTNVIGGEPRAAPPPGGPPGREPDPSNRFGWGMLIGLLLLLALAGGGLALWFATRGGDGNATTTTAPPTATTQTALAAPGRVFVPDVTGLTEEEAGARLGRAGLEPDVRRQATGKPTGAVVSQAPKAGTQAKKGSKVRLVVDEGAPLVAVPDVTGKDVAGAGASLKRVGLDTATTKVTSDAAPGTVVAQDPAAGDKAKPGSVVTLSVAKGGGATTVTVTTTSRTTTSAQPPQPRNATVPDLADQELADAAEALEQAGIYPNVVYIPSDERIGTVLEQSKQSGTEVPRGSYVRINVAEGPDPAPDETVPDVRGKQRADAMKTLSGAGFEVKVVERPLPAAKPNDTVVDEQPSRGTKIPGGALVILIVGMHAG